MLLKFFDSNFLYDFSPLNFKFDFNKLFEGLYDMAFLLKKAIPISSFSLELFTVFVPSLYFSFVDIIISFRLNCNLNFAIIDLKLFFEEVSP